MERCYRQGMGMDMAWVEGMTFELDQHSLMRSDLGKAEYLDIVVEHCSKILAVVLENKGCTG